MFKFSSLQSWKFDNLGLDKKFAECLGKLQVKYLQVKKWQTFLIIKIIIILKCWNDNLVDYKWTAMSAQTTWGVPLCLHLFIEANHSSTSATADLNFIVVLQMGQLLLHPLSCRSPSRVLVLRKFTPLILFHFGRKLEVPYKINFKTQKTKL